MQVKLLSTLVEELAGEGTGRIADILFNKRDVNEFLIAKKMELTINQVRNILYKLSNFGLVSFIRKKDNKKGWYIYYWTLNTEKCLVLIESSLESKIEELGAQLRSREGDRYYICHICAIEVKEEQALEHGFTCEECAGVYELQDNSAHIRDIKARMTRIAKELEMIQGELEELRKKEDKKRQRVERKLQKEADERKTLLRQARAAARKKVAKQSPSVKKPTAASTKKPVKKAASQKRVRVAAKSKPALKRPSRSSSRKKATTTKKGSTRRAKS